MASRKKKSEEGVPRQGRKRRLPLRLVEVSEPDPARAAEGMRWLGRMIAQAYARDMALAENEDGGPSVVHPRRRRAVTQQKTESRAAAQAGPQAAAAIEQLIGPERETYEHNKALAQAFWPGLSEFQAAWLARVATQLELDILRQEIIWYQERPLRQAQGRPYITIKGLVRLLNRQPQFDNYDLEPASEELRRSMRVSREEEQVWVCRLWRKDRTRPAVGYGRATPEDTSVGYGRVDGEEPGNGDQAPGPAPSAGSGQAFRTPAVAEMAQERAVRHAAQSAFSWEFMSTLEAPASEEHRRVDPESGDISPLIEDGSPNTVGCTAAQRRCIHALAWALSLAEGKVDTEAGEVLEDGWRADLYRLYGVTSTMHLAVAQAREFIDSLTREHQELDELQSPQEIERRDLWRRIQELLRSLPGDTPKRVCAWFQREHGVEVKREELKRIHPPHRVPTLALRRLVQGLEGYLMKLEPEA